MALVHIVLGGWAALASLALLAMHANVLRQSMLFRRLDELFAETPDPWPTVSVLVPARNEAEDLEAALESLLAQDYPELEIVVADDRSTDGTGELLDRIASRDDRITAVHIEKLPDDWLGKLYALHRAKEVSTGEWLVLTDADVEHAPDTIRTAVRAVEGEDADHLACMPRMLDHDFVMEVAYAAFLLGLFQVTSVAGIEDPDAEDFMGIGAFNLVRREILEAAGGFEQLRMEVADDVGIGYLVKRQKGVSRLALASDRLEVTWYDSLEEMIAGMEKNAFASVGHYSYLRVAGYSLLWGFLFFGPLIGLLSQSGLIFAASLAAIVFHPVVSVLAALKFDRSPLPFAARFVGEWIMFYVLLRSTYKCWDRGGIRWRDTTYPLERLREQQRVRL